jgi:hypothetical protein
VSADKPSDHTTIHGEYLKEIKRKDGDGSDLYNKDNADNFVGGRAYDPAKTPHEALKRIKDHVAAAEEWNMSFSALSEKQKKCCRMLREYLNNLRFVTQINTYNGKMDRDLFESSFVRCVYDKFDLTEEEVDQYIMYSTEVVKSYQLTRNINSVQDLIDGQMDDDTKQSQKLSMSYIEQLDNLHREYNECSKRQGTLLAALKQKRSDRLASQKNRQASIIDLVEAWKQEDERKRILKYAEERNDKIRGAIEEYRNMDDVRARIFGISEDEVING